MLMALSFSGRLNWISSAPLRRLTMMFRYPAAALLFAGAFYAALFRAAVFFAAVLRAADLRAGALRAADFFVVAGFLAIVPSCRGPHGARRPI